jgi:hypothetical protein
MYGVFKTIDPPPPHRPACVYPPPLVRGEDTLAGWRGGGGSIDRKTPDAALYSVLCDCTLQIKRIRERLYCRGLPTVS